MRFLFMLIVLLFPLGLFAQAIGTQAPDFTLNSLEHGEIKLSNFKGKVVYLFILGYG